MAGKGEWRRKRQTEYACVCECTPTKEVEQGRVKRQGHKIHLKGIRNDTKATLELVVSYMNNQVVNFVLQNVISREINKYFNFREPYIINKVRNKNTMIPLYPYLTKFPPLL